MAIAKKPLHYFCYISEAKIDQLVQQLTEHQVDSITEEQLVEKRRDANPSLGRIAGLFALGATFGRSDRVTVSKTKRDSLVQKLRIVVLNLAQSNCLPSLDDVLAGSQSVFATYEGVFRVKQFDDHSAVIQSTLPNGKWLELACSMKYFSDMGRERNSIVPHSGNILFFKGKVTPTFSTVLLLQGTKGKRIFGSPLYLALSTRCTTVI